MRTLDRGFLAANPSDGSPAELSFEAKATDKMGIPRNPDGTRPSVTITATGPTWLTLIQTLDRVHGMDVMDVLGWLLPEDYDEATVADPTRPFQDFTGDVDLTTEDGTEAKVRLTVHAPCLVAGVRALAWVTRPQAQSAAIAVCPTVEDEEFDDEVLVMP